VLSFGVTAQTEEPCVVARLRMTQGTRTLWDEAVASRAVHWQARVLHLTGPETVRLSVAAGDCGDGLERLRVSVPRLYADATSNTGRVLVWVSQDALRADHLSVYGYPRPTSPHAQALAERAVVFEQADASASWTLPSMATQFTGRHPSSHGAVMNKLATRDPTLWTTLAAAGFTVLGSSANEFVSHRHGLGDGFDVLKQSARRTPGQLRELLDQLSEWRGGDLALFVHLLDPHLPYDPPAAQRARFDVGYKGRPTGDNYFHRRTPIGPAERRQLVALYDAEIAANDEALGAFFERLRALRLWERAVIVYTSDHGEEFQEHGQFLHGATLYQEVLHVPLIIAAPGLGARRVHTPVSLVDLAPTVLDLLGAPALGTAQGQSLRALLEGRPRARTALFSETILTPDRSQLVSVRLGERKYIARLPRGGTLPAQALAEHLYDLGLDRGESRDLLRGSAPADATVLRRLAWDYLTRTRAAAGPTRTVVLDAEAEAKLRAWGYIQ
jgi:arylsulfatase A-like enzyme